MPKGVYKRKDGWKPTNAFFKGYIPWHKGKKIPYKARKKGMKKPWISLRFKGKPSWNKGISYHAKDKHWNWQGGKTILSYQIRHLFEYRLWRSDCFKRDDFTCQICSKRGGGEMHVDHIKKFCVILEENNIKTLEEAENCAELWNINNGRTLCRECHKKTETYGNNN